LSTQSIRPAPDTLTSKQSPTILASTKIKDWRNVNPTPRTHKAHSSPDFQITPCSSRAPKHFGPYFESDYTKSHQGVCTGSGWLCRSGAHLFFIRSLFLFLL
jgi:hypothetical protein